MARFYFLYQSNAVIFDDLPFVAVEKTLKKGPTEFPLLLSLVKIRFIQSPIPGGSWIAFPQLWLPLWPAMSRERFAYSVRPSDRQCSGYVVGTARCALPETGRVSRSGRGVLRHKRAVSYQMETKLDIYGKSVS